MDAEAALIDSELNAKLQELQEAADAVSQGRLLAVVTVLLSRCSTDSHIAAVAGAVRHIAQLLDSEDQTVQVCWMYSLAMVLLIQPSASPMSASVVAAC